MSAHLCLTIEGVPASRTYIKFAGCEGYLWEWKDKIIASLIIAARDLC
jgi:hypothetical protein